MNYKEIKCKLTQEDEKSVQEINTFFQDFKKEYINADSKKEFFRVNNITDENIQKVIFNLKLIFDLFKRDDNITIETINKVAKEHKKKAENILKTLCRRIEEYEDNRK